MNNNFEIRFVHKLFKVFILLLLAGNAFSQPVAKFSATPVSGCSPLLVNFTDLSTGTPDSWKWDLGNGTISFVQNPSVSYFSPGKYKITLIAGNNNGGDTIIKVNYITVQELPRVDFSADITKGCYPLNIQFSDKSNTPGDTSSWQWDFGDGNVDFSKNPRHTYTSSGSYSVTLTIRNLSGCENTFTRPQYIEILEDAKADFIYNNQSSCALPVTSVFENLSSGSGTLNYQWNFGDGTTSSAKDPTHVFKTSGNFRVQLLASTLNGCVDTAQTIIKISEAKANFSAPDSVCRNQPFTLTNNSTASADNVKWTFGDGTTSTLLNPSKIFKTAGTYTVKLVADLGECVDSISKKIVVRSRYRFDFKADTQKNCVAPLTVKFSSDIGNATIHKWDFGDGETSTAVNPVHTYDELGTFDVSLIVISAAGCPDTLRKRGFIRLRTPALKILDLPAEGCVPFSFTFFAETDDDLTIQSYLWNFGDGSTSSLPNPAHVFSEVGRYTISLSIITSGGCSKKTTVTKGISAGTKPKADFVADVTDVCASVKVKFKDLSIGDVNGWLWKFGDGKTSTEQNPTHIYQDTGLFTVTLIANNTGCKDEITFKDYIHIKGPVAAFGLYYTCEEPLKRLFTDSSIGADTWLWDFGDGTISTLQNPPEHMYADTGIYTVSLSVKNLSNGCEFTKEDTLPLVTPKAAFNTNNTSVCKGSETMFFAEEMFGAYISTYEWDFGDGAFDIADNDSITHKYQSQGVKSIQLITTDILGCSDTLAKPDYINVQGPSVFFQVSSGGCLNKNISFTDSSQSDGTHPLKQWIWNYGDGTVTAYTSPPFQHNYATAGAYTISLKVFDSNGCVDSLEKENLIEISQPEAQFSTNDTASCPLRNLKFINLSAGQKFTSFWNFGDGATSAAKNPSHQYSADGIYTISLTITDQYGCTAFIEKHDHIVISSPRVDFTTTDTLSPCSPFLASFTNVSSDYKTLLWNFGDSNLSTLPNPSHVYSYPGVYYVSLKATGAGGCSEEKTATVTVQGPQGVFSYVNHAGCDSVKTDFTAFAKNSDSFIWDFNDGTTLSNNDATVSHMYINPGFYVPKLILISENCQVPLVGQDTIRIYTVTAAFKSSQNIICDSGFVSFTDSTYSNDVINNYLWNFGDGTSSTVKNPLHFYTVAGQYKPEVMVVTKYGCMDTTIAAMPVKIFTSPQLSIASDSGACTPATIIFKGELVRADTSAISWLWNFGNGNTSTLQNPPSQTYTVKGQYTITATGTNSSSCSSTFKKIIEAYPIPLVKTIQDSFVCLGSSITLQVTGAAAYTWSPTATLSCIDCDAPVATPINTATYIVEGRSLWSCKAKDTVSILVKFPFSISVSGNDSLCLGRSMRLNATGADNYIWIPATGLDDPTKGNPVASPTESTNYTVIGSDDKKCFSDTGYMAIRIFALPTVSAGADTTINVGQTAVLTPKLSADVTDVKWTPATGIIANNFISVTVQPEATVEYTVLATNAGNCMARDMITVYVICNNANVFIPNTFSPDGNGTNDIFYPRGSGLFKIKSLRIFNRWGGLVFQKSNLVPNDPKAGWDGSYKGKIFAPDVFIYQVDVVCSNGSTLTYKGNVALIL